MKDSTYASLVARDSKLAVVGLGYVGMPIAIEFAKQIDVLGFDTNASKIETYLSGVDPTGEVGDEAISTTKMEFTTSESKLRDCSFIVVAVPTPINHDKTPDLAPVIKASECVGRNLTKGAIVVFESTVYPGVTEDICVPILEQESGLRYGIDFKVGYSPERINPGDKVHTLRNIVKVVSASDDESLEEISQVYSLVVDAGVYRASNIRTAEAIKVVENSQRDVNIAFMNELALVFDRMGIDTNEVVDGMNTKWNALGFRPGLVGGHCIGVDPYYFTYEAEKLGYHSQIVLSGRRINDGMAEFVGETAIKLLVRAGAAPALANVYVLGLTFKENCPDIRNTKVIDVVRHLESYGVSPRVVDPWADAVEAKSEYGIDLYSLEDVRNADCVILAVGHEEFKSLSTDTLRGFFRSREDSILLDVKAAIPRETRLNAASHVWSL